jgi:hypothetical protein
MMTDMFKDWHDFYVVVGGGAAALTGLVFVVMTLVAARSTTFGSDGPSGEGTSVYSTPTVVLFSTAFFISCIAVMPWPTPACPGLFVALLGLLGLIYVARISMRGLRMDGYTADVEDRTWFMAMPFVAYIALTIAGAAIAFGARLAPFALALVTLFLVLTGIRNAWDVGSYISIRRDD